MALKHQNETANELAFHGMGHRMHRHMIPGCAMGQPAAATCACGTAAVRLQMVWDNL